MGETTTMSVPAALRGTRSVKLSTGETVQATRWSWTKFMDIVEHLDKWLGDVDNATVDRITKGSVRHAAFGFIQLIGKKAIDFCKLAVDKPDLVNDDLTPEDVIALLEAILDLNMTENLLKKANALWTKFQPLSRGSK